MVAHIGIGRRTRDRHRGAERHPVAIAIEPARPIGAGIARLGIAGLLGRDLGFAGGAAMQRADGEGLRGARRLGVV